MAGAGPAQIADAKDVPFQPWAKAVYDFRQTTELEPHTRCKASGGPRQFVTPYGVEVMEIPELKRAFIFDIGGPHTFRTIFMDGRGHPDNWLPTNYGHSIGWWDGDTLVIDTVGFNDKTWLDPGGHVHSDQMHTIERFTRLTENQLKYEFVIDDPVMYTKPWGWDYVLVGHHDWEIIEYVCNENNKSVMEGHITNRGQAQ